MADESYSFSTARTRLEAIVTQVRKKDTSLEKSLDLLEEGVRLANACTEQIDRADWVTPESMADSEVVPGEVPAEEAGDAAEAVAETTRATPRSPPTQPRPTPPQPMTPPMTRGPTTGPRRTSMVWTTIRRPSSGNAEATERRIALVRHATGTILK